MLLDALCFWSRRSLHEFEVITYYINYIISIHNSHYVSFWSIKSAHCSLHSLHQADWCRWYTKFFGTFALGHSRIKLVWSIEWLSTFSSQVWGKWLCRNVGSWCLHPRMKRSTTYPIWSKSSDWVDRINLTCRKNCLEIFQAIQWSTNGIYLIHDVITPFVRRGWPPSSCPLIWHLAFSPFLHDAANWGLHVCLADTLKSVPEELLAFTVWSLVELSFICSAGKPCEAVPSLGRLHPAREAQQRKKPPFDGGDFMRLEIYDWSALGGSLEDVVVVLKMTSWLGCRGHASVLFFSDFFVWFSFEVCFLADFVAYSDAGRYHSISVFV